MGPIRNPNWSTSGMRVTLSYLFDFLIDWKFKRFCLILYPTNAFSTSMSVASIRGVWPEEEKEGHVPIPLFDQKLRDKWNLSTETGNVQTHEIWWCKCMFWDKITLVPLFSLSVLKAYPTFRYSPEAFLPHFAVLSRSLSPLINLPYRVVDPCRLSISVNVSILQDSCKILIYSRFCFYDAIRLFCIYL